MTDVQLTAAAQPLELLDAPADTPDADRVVSGLVLPYGPIGYTSVGPVRVPRPGLIAIPQDLSRIKLMDYHQTPGVAIGYCTALRETPDGLRASFRVANTAAGSAAWLDIVERVRDGLSVEMGAISLDGDELLGGDLLGVSLVPIPAWENARHDGLAAAREDSNTTTTTERNTAMTPEQRARLAELIAMNARTAEEEGEFAELVRLLATAPEDAPAADAAPELAASHATVPPVGVPAAAPFGAPGAPPRQRRELRELFAATARVLSGTSRPELEAALADITTTANIWTAGTAYDGELWSGLEYKRRFVQLLVSAPMTSYKGTGWRWVVKPAVGDYAGDKAAVPSNSPTTEATTWNAARLAGAHDIDRKFWDFGDTEFIASYYRALTEDYAMKSDLKALAKLLAVGAAGTAITGATTLVGAALRAADGVMTGTNGETPDYFLVSSANLITAAENGSLSQMGDNSALAAFGVTPEKFLVAPGLAAGTVIAGTRNSVRWRELGEVPIRVETINIANGGIDGGVFGYYATETVRQAGVQRATFA